LIHLHLRAILVARDAAAHLHHVATIEIFSNARIAQLPHARLDGPGLVAERQVQVRLALFRCSLLPGQNQEEAVEELSSSKPMRSET